MWIRKAPWGYVLLILGGTFLLGAAVAGAFREWGPFWRLLGPGIGALALGAASVRRRPSPLKPGEAAAFAAASYLLFSLVGAIPFSGNAAFLDGWFEALSGITTTGLSVLDPTAVPRSLLFFRALYQWIGGAGIILISLAFLLPPGRAAVALYAAEYGQENVFGNARLVARRVAAVYGSLTVVGYGAYLLSGMDPFTGACHILSTLSTGGFSPLPGSIGAYRSPATQAVVALFMVLGATSFPALWMALRPGGWRRAVRDPEFLLLVILPLVLGGVAAGALGSAGAGLFQAVSALTTTGFATVPTPQLPPAARWAVILAMALGGMGGSTAGGIKLFRVLGLAAAIRWHLRRAALPGSAQVPFRVLGRTFPAEEATAMAAFVLLYIGIIATSTLILTAMGYGIGDSLFEAVSAQGTVGLSAGIAAPGAPAAAKLLLMLLMWLGRLEIVPVILLFRKAVSAG